jgi:hypothetical protein
MTRQLPATRCVGHAILSVRNNIVYAFRISWPWYAVITLIGLGANFIAQNITGGNVEANPGPVIPLYLIVAFINILGFSSIAVNWHRYILLDEVPRGSELFRLDDKVWRYFGNVLLIVLIIFGIGLALGIPVGVLATLSEATAVLGVILFLVALPFIVIVFYRLSVKLPAIALGRRDFLMRDAWAATRENKLSIFLVGLFHFLIALGMVLVLFALTLALVAMNEMLAVIVSTIIQVVLSWLLAIFGITILTSLYGFFVEGRDF